MSWSLAGMVKDAGLSGATVARRRYGVSVDGAVMSWTAGVPLDQTPDLASLVEVYRAINPDADITVIVGAVMAVPVEWVVP